MEKVRTALVYTHPVTLVAALLAVTIGLVILLAALYTAVAVLLMYYGMELIERRLSKRAIPQPKPGTNEGIPDKLPDEWASLPPINVIGDKPFDEWLAEVQASTRQTEKPAQAAEEVASEEPAPVVVAVEQLPVSQPVVEKARRSEDREANIQAAVHAALAGTSVRKAAKLHGVPESTVRSRIKRMVG